MRRYGSLITINPLVFPRLSNRQQRTPPTFSLIVSLTEFRSTALSVFEIGRENVATSQANLVTHQAPMQRTLQRILF